VDYALKNLPPHPISLLKMKKAAAAAQQKVNKEVLEATVCAQHEFPNKLEKTTRDKQSKIFKLTTTTAKLRNSLRIMGDIGPGCYAKVKEDFSPGKCSHGGRGYAVALEGKRLTQTFSVKYNKCATAGMSVETRIM